MARLRVFVSSTCYDLSIIRSELRPFIVSLGYDPVMSDYSDVLYDHRSHTHDSCIKEVPTCDVILLIIGSRFGGKGIPEVQDNFDFNLLKESSSNTKILEYKDKLSITQLEILKAIQSSIPVYTFVDEKVWHDHLVYEKNKESSDFIDKIVFPSIQKNESAKYIFEFMNFLTHRTKNNSIFTFSRLDEIKKTLVTQWSQLFQRLLAEDKNRITESKRYKDFSERLEDLKTVVLASIATPDLRETARGAIQYRHLISFLSNLGIDKNRDILFSELSWEDLMEKLGIVRQEEVRTDRGFRPKLLLIKNDATFFTCRFPTRYLEKFKKDWSNFVVIGKESKEAIVDATLKDIPEKMNNRDIIYHSEKYEEFINKINENQNEDLEMD